MEMMDTFGLVNVFEGPQHVYILHSFYIVHRLENQILSLPHLKSDDKGFGKCFFVGIDI